MLKRVWILTIAVVIMMAMGSRHAALAETVIELKTGVILKTNVTFKGFMCGTATVKDADSNSYNTVLIGTPLLDG